MASQKGGEPSRRVPQRPRSEQRSALLLNAAAAVIEEVGYDAATMTAIAQRAGSSIGAAYQYYADKAEIAEALCNKLGEELSTELEQFADRASALSLRRMVLQLVALVTDFSDRHPALLLLMHVSREHEPAFRRRLRLRLAQLFQSKTPELSEGEAYRIAATVLQVLKSLHLFAGEADPFEQRHLKDEVVTMLTKYLEYRLQHPEAATQS